MKKKSIFDSRKFFFLVGMTWFWLFFFLFVIAFNYFFTNLKLNILWSSLFCSFAVITNFVFAFIFSDEKEFRKVILLLADINLNFGSLMSANLCLNAHYINTVFWFGGLCTYYGTMIGSFNTLRLLMSQSFYILFYRTKI